MSAKIPQVQSADRNQNQYQSGVAKALTLLLNNPIPYGTTLTNVNLIMGTNVVPHKLGRKLQGWVVTRQRYDSPATALVGIQDLQDTNRTPDQTLVLNSTAVVSVDIYVF